MISKHLTVTIIKIMSYVCYVLFCIQGKFMEKNNIGIRNACEN